MAVDDFSQSGNGAGLNKVFGQKIAAGSIL
jgi:hypothetical protein